MKMRMCLIIGIIVLILVIVLPAGKPASHAATMYAANKYLSAVLATKGH